jgi:N-acetylmuramoyl-L-alanine amidase
MLSISRLSFLLLTLLVLALFGCTSENPTSLTGKIIVVDPGHGGTADTDNYRVGPGGEREEWIDLRVGLMLRDLLEEKGARVLMTRTSDSAVALADRARLAVDNNADLFVSIHHNATADSSVNFPIVYYHGTATQNKAGTVLAHKLAIALVQHMYPTETPFSIVSDFTIFSQAGTSVLRGTYGIPGVIAEASFFTNPAEEQRLKQRDHNMKEAVAYGEAIESFFDQKAPEILPKDSTNFPPKFETLQEADRMSEVAMRWKEDFEEGVMLMEKEDSTSLNKAYELFTRSARSFPDSYLAGKCHHYRAILLREMGDTVAAKAEEKRVREYYPGF